MRYSDPEYTSAQAPLPNADRQVCLPSLPCQRMSSLPNPAVCLTLHHAALLVVRGRAIHLTQTFFGHAGVQRGGIAALLGLTQSGRVGEPL
jgi:hypothetical protein